MKEQIVEILATLRPDMDALKETAMIDDHKLDSFDIISLVSELNDTFGVDINVEDLEPKNFNTVDAMVELVEKLQSEG